MLIENEVQVMTARMMELADGLEAHDDILPHLGRFILPIREDTPDLHIFQVREAIHTNEDQLTFTEPDAFEVYRNAWMASQEEGTWRDSMGVGYYIDWFARGVSTVGQFLNPEEFEPFGTFVGRILNKIEHDEVYPAILVEYARHYMDIIEAVLGNGEESTKGQMLAYSVGVWWAFGHMIGVEEAELQGRKGQSVVDWVYSELLNWAKLGIVPEG